MELFHLNFNQINLTSYNFTCANSLRIDSEYTKIYVQTYRRF